MEKKYYAAKLHGPRPTFPHDMTDEEKAIMQQHVAYGRKLMDEGIIIVYGPVLDPAGVYGLGIFCVETEDQLKKLLADDPAAQIGRYEYHPMMASVPEK